MEPAGTTTSVSSGEPRSELRLKRLDAFEDDRRIGWRAFRPGERRRARNRPRQIGLFGLFGCGNFGNDGSLEAMLGFLRHATPDLELVCICADPDKIRISHCVTTLPIDSSHVEPRSRAGALPKLAGKLIDLVQAVRRVRSIGLLIIPGTGILDDFGERPWGMPYHLLKWCLAARLCGTKVAFVSIGAGPINHPLSRRLMTLAARLAHYRSYRDTISKDYMASIGFDVSRDRIYPDIAFRLPPLPNSGERTSTHGDLTVGVGLMSYSGWYNFADAGPAIYSEYVAKITSFVLWLLDRGHRVRFLTGETSDQRTVDDVLERIRDARPDVDGHRIVSEPAASLHDLMRHIADTDVVVATRFHNIVCALKLCRPTVSLGYAQKNDVLLTDMGLGAFCQHVERIDLEILISQFTELVSRRELYEERIRTTNCIYAERLQQQETELLNGLLEQG